MNAHRHLHEGTNPTRRYLKVPIETRGYRPLRTTGACAAAAARYNAD